MLFKRLRKKHRPHLPLPEAPPEGVIVDDAGERAAPSTPNPSTAISGAGDRGRCFSPAAPPAHSGTKRGNFEDNVR